MCTVTWTRDGKEYELFMNRDELHSRGSASPPEVRRRKGVKVIAPIDADGGGTWIAANEWGLTICLLNHYPDAGEPLVRESSGDRRSSGDDVGSYSNRRRAGEGLPTPFARESGRRKSRGLLVLELSSAASCTEVTRALGTAGLHDYRPFLLLAVGPRCGPTLHRWDGETLLLIDDPIPPVATSSFDTRRVVETRIASYEAIVDERVDGDSGGSFSRSESAALHAYHASHRPERGPYSVCTHREDGATKSLSHVTVSREAVGFAYAQGPPCSSELGSAVTVSRSSAG
jgi:hypothetical protein